MATNPVKWTEGSETEEAKWQRLYQIGAVAAGLAVVSALSEIVITFLPGGSTSPDTVAGWYALLQENWFMGVRNLGLLNIVFTTLAIPTFFALYGAQRRQAVKSYAALALFLFFLGAATFFATNRAFSMLDLSRQFAAATSTAQQATLLAAGQAMLAVGQSHTPGTFLGFFFSEIAGLSMSIVMLQSHVFSKAAAYTGIAGFALLLLFEICTSFVPSLFAATIFFGIGGGLLEMVWYALIARKLLNLGRASGMEDIKLTSGPSQGIGTRNRSIRARG
jgi:hypothetical protein